MAGIGKHAHVVLYYMGLLNKPYLVKVMEAAKKENQGFGKFTFEDADTFKGYIDPRFDGAVIDGSVRKDLSERIQAAYETAGKRVQVVEGTFEEEFKRFEEQAGISGRVTSDPPASQTDNVTASLSSPQAHVETDGRNDPRPWQGATGTSLDGFGLPLTTTDRRGEGLDLAAQTAAVQNRTAEQAADAGSAVADIADRGSDGASKLAERAAQAREAAGSTEGAGAGSGDTSETSGEAGGQPSETSNTGQGGAEKAPQGGSAGEPAKEKNGGASNKPAASTKK